MDESLINKLLNYICSSNNERGWKADAQTQGAIKDITEFQQYSDCEPAENEPLRCKYLGQIFMYKAECGLDFSHS